MVFATLNWPAAAPTTTNAPPAPTEAEAAAFFDSVWVRTLEKDVKGNAALYAEGAILIDPAKDDFITTPEGNIASNEENLAFELASIEWNYRTIQILGADTIIDNAVMTFRSSNPTNFSSTMRVVSVAHRQADGSWKVVNQHGSSEPKVLHAFSAPPIIKTITATAPPQPGSPG